MAEEPQSLEPLLALHERDRAAGLMDAPWPPVYPKMPGEPPRVAPSRAKKAKPSRGSRRDMKESLPESPRTGKVWQPIARPRDSGMDESVIPSDVEARLAMPLAEAMLTQRSVRRVEPDPVDDRIVVRCLELALEAPTSSNGQNWEFVVVKDRAVKASLAAQYRRAWRLYGGIGQRIKTDQQTSKILKSVQWQVEHFEEIPVLVVCCLRGGVRVPFLPEPPIAASSHYGSIYPSVQNLLSRPGPSA